MTQRLRAARRATADFEQLMKKRSADSTGLVYKTYTPQPVQQQRSPATDTAQEWNTWFGASFKNYMAAQPLFTKGQKDVLVETIVLLRKEYRAYVAEQIAARLKEETEKLHEEIGALRADLTILRAQVDGTVKKMRGRDVA